VKVVMVETGGWGGLAHYAWNLCRALVAEGADVYLLTSARYELAELDGGFRVDPCLTAGLFPRVAARLLGRIAALAPDVVHVQSLLSTRFDAALWPLARRRARLVATAHNVRPHEHGRWEEWTLWRTLRTADTVVTHTREAADLALRRLGSGHRVEIIHHGDYAFFRHGRAADRAAARRTLGLPERGQLLLAFGAIRPYKGLLDLIGALPAVQRRHPEAHLVVIGPLLVGSRDEYEQAIARAHVSDAVTFRPVYVPHDDVATYFAAADVAVFNYRDVTDSGALRVAASLGTPIVATSVGAFREFLADGATGRLVPPGDARALAATLGDVLADVAGAARMADAARALSESTWSWADSAHATLALYRSLVASPSPGLLRARRGRTHA
jgi:glycosyltransferase involved in cell wall biosynthesis